MPQSKILVDTNAHLRLAQTIRPLLSVPFGDKEYCLYILPELNKELGARKLQTKFPWVNEIEFVENCQYFPKVGRKQKKSIEETFKFIWQHVQAELPGPSIVDTWYIAYALELGVPVVTDDQDMTELAQIYEIPIMSTLDLLKIMLECGHTDMKIINGLIQYWQYFTDMPANFKSDYLSLFSDQSVVE